MYVVYRTEYFMGTYTKCVVARFKKEIDALNEVRYQKAKGNVVWIRTEI